MILASTPTLHGYTVSQTLSIVYSDVVVGANFVKDFFARMTDSVGGRSSSYEKAYAKARQKAIDELVESAESQGADAIIGIDFQINSIGRNGTILQLSCHGTAVKLSYSK